jgi:cytoskeletal protein CcmA (bactofilin family)
MFSKKPATTDLPQTTRPGSSAMSGGTFSVLGADVSIKGDITASADLHVDGRVEGDITCASLVQGGSSEIVGSVRAESARLSGIVRGSITAVELVILKSARIEGDVHYDAVTIEQGAEVDGRFAHRVHAAPAPAMAAPAVPLSGDDGEPRLTLAS